MSFQNFRQYLSECVRLLYWSHFKPFTLNHWLKQEVHPDLKCDSNPFDLSQDFASNSKLRRYADQMVWLNVVTLWLMTFLVTTLYSFFIAGSLLGIGSVLFLVGWSLGSLWCLCATDKERTTNWLFSLASLLVILSFFVSEAGFLSFLVSVATFMVFGVGLGMILFEGKSSKSEDKSLRDDDHNKTNSEMPSLNFFGTRNGILSFIMVFIWIQIMLVHAEFGRGTDEMWMMIKIDSPSKITDPDISISHIFSSRSGLDIVVSLMFGLLFGMMFIIILTVIIAICIWFWSWLLELVWVTFLYLYLPPTKQRLQWLPPYFDEFMVSPLPFMTTILTETYRIDPQATQDTIDYLLNRTNQQQIAGQAMLWIALDNFLHCQKEEDIALATQQLQWIPSPPPKEMGIFVPQCLDISQAVQAARNATSLYNHARMLEAPLKQLTQLRQQLAYEKEARIATQLGAITQQWQNILEEAHQTLEEQAKQSQSLPLPYVPGNALSLASGLFRGRQDLFLRFEDLSLAEQPPVLLLYGGRRAGKTSALRQLPNRLPSSIVPLLIGLQKLGAVSTLTGVASSLADTMTEVARRNCNLYLPTYDPQAFAQDPFFALGKWFKQIENTFPDKRFFLCLDEFEKFEEVVTTTGSHAPLHFLRHLFEHQPRWIVLFAGSHYLNELENYWSDYLINAQILYISYLETPEARDLIVKPTPDFPEEVYDPAAVDAILRHTRCQPYLVQLLCLTVVEHLNQLKQRQATVATVEERIPATIKKGLLYFNELWNNILREPHHEVLAQLIRQHPLAEDEKTIIAVNYLISKEVLEQVESGYRFQVPLVQRFVEGKLRGEWG